MAKKNNDAPGMRGDRSRNDDGQLRQKRSDMHLGTYLEKNNIASLNDLINDKKADK